MVNKGLQQHRFKGNPLEEQFALQWEKQNDTESPGRRYGTLDYLLMKGNEPAGEVSERDREVAATIIQWLGTPVGRSFLIDTLKEAPDRSDRDLAEKLEILFRQKGW